MGLDPPALYHERYCANSDSTADVTQGNGQTGDAVLVVVLFGRRKIPELMGDVAKGIKNFKKGMSDEEAAAADKAKTVDHKADEVK